MHMRSWLYSPDEPPAGDEAVRLPVNPSGTDGNVPLDQLPAAWQEEIRKLRQENADRRKRATELESQETERLKKAGEYKTLAEQRELEVQQLTGYKTQAEAYEKLILDENAKRIAAMPETLRVVVPKGLTPLTLKEWLDASLPLLTRPKPPELNAGAGGSGSADMTLSESELVAAKRMGMTPEQYWKNKPENRGKT
jgi:hypothetical protein